MTGKENTMKLEHFHYLLEVRRLHSISAAARKLQLNQTTLSAIIRSAEKEIGFPIFQRTPEGVDATKAGEQLMSLAWEIDLKYERLMALKHRASWGVPAVTLFLSPTIAGKTALPLLDLFSSFDIPGNLTFNEAPSEEIPERIKNHEANLGLASFSQSELNTLKKNSQTAVQTEILMEDQIYLLVSSKHPLASSGSVSIPEIYGYRLATVKRRQNDDMVLGSLHHFCRSVTCFSRLDPFLASIRDQGLVGFIPGFTFDPLLCSGCTLIPVKNTERENRLLLCLVTCADRKLRPQEEILVQCIHHYFRTENGCDINRKEGMIK